MNNLKKKYTKKTELKCKNIKNLNSQKEYWNNKLGQEFNLRVLFGISPDLELIKTILALNSDSPIRIDALKMLGKINKNIESK